MFYVSVIFGHVQMNNSIKAFIIFASFFYSSSPKIMFSKVIKTDQDVNIFPLKKKERDKRKKETCLTKVLSILGAWKPFPSVGSSRYFCSIPSCSSKYLDSEAHLFLLPLGHPQAFCQCPTLRCWSSLDFQMSLQGPSPTM